jgi:cytochrome P450
MKKSSKLSMRYFYMLSQESARLKKRSFSSQLLDAQDQEGISDLEVATLTANLIGGGVDTTSSTMISCILAMWAFPEVQRKAQGEIDAVVGHDRSPTWEDVEDKLPYMAALVQEVLRWRTVTILAGVPHASTVDYEYQGYLIPAGAPLISNMWAIHRNPRDFPDPDVVRPERFLKGELKRPYPNSKGSNPFGWGRRQ